MQKQTTLLVVQQQESRFLWDFMPFSLSLSIFTQSQGANSKPHDAVTA
jgi:hypothetical protein